MTHLSPCEPDEPGSAGEREIEITPEMIEAGRMALVEYSRDYEAPPMPLFAFSRL